MAETGIGSQGQRIDTRGGTYGGEHTGRDRTGIDGLVQFIASDADAERAGLAVRNRKIMICQVRDFWIEGVLRQSLYEVARVELDMDEQPGAATHPWEMVVQRPERETTPARPLLERHHRAVPRNVGDDAPPGSQDAPAFRERLRGIDDMLQNRAQHHAVAASGA